MPSITAKGLLGFVRPSNPNAPSPLEIELVTLFNQLFPEMQGDLFSFLQDSTCGCKTRLIEALNRNPAQAEQLVKLIYRDVPAERPAPEFAITTEDVTDPATLTSIAGTVMDIEPSRDAYRTQIRQLYAERKVYQGVFLEFKPNTWTLYFY
jgi:hypothetical protein